MGAIVLVILQIFLLLLKAHFNRSDDQEKAMQAVREAQEKLAGLAEAFEERVRYSNPNQGEVENLEDQMDRERAKNETK